MSPRAKPGAGHLRAGAQAEDQALALLQAGGLKLVERNFRTRRGEIDLVMLDGDVLAFVEVRFRATGALVGPEHSITWSKQRRLVLAAEEFLSKRQAFQSRRCRFDVIAVSGDAPPRWIPAAFDA